MHIIKSGAALIIAAMLSTQIGVTDRDLQAQTRPKPLDAKYVDPQLRTGTLPNGLRYMVRQNAVPAGRVELRLVIDAGSILEDDDQRGLAHFIEHMAFNGTKRFPKHRLIEYLESVGMTFGNDLNASTSYDETIYELTVPSEPVVLDTALMILEDWVQSISFDPAEIEAERGVVMEERRVRAGPKLRQYQRHAPVLLGNRYAARMPIGMGQILKTAQRDEFVRFYNDWYRPDLMTVIVVGDFDPVIMEATIKQRFGRIPKRTAPRPRPAVAVPTWNSGVASIAEDEAVTDWSAELIFPLGISEIGWSTDALRRRAVSRLFYRILNDRLRVLARSDGSPVREASAKRTTLGRDKLAHAFWLRAEEPTTLELGIIAVRAELARLARDGVLPGELDLARTMLIEQANESRLKADTRSSAALVQRYIQSALERSDFPSERAEAELLLQFLPSVTAADLKALAMNIEEITGWLVLANAPKSSSHGTLTTTMLLESMRSGERHRLQPFRDTALARSLNVEALLANKPASGHIVQRRTLAGINVTEWILSNGARVILKPTPWTKDEVVVQAMALGGVSAASDAEYLSASVASDLVMESGLGPYDGKTLARRLAGKVGRWGVIIQQDGQSFSSVGSPRHAESIFELMHLGFTSPRIDKEVFAKWRREARRNYPSGFEFQYQRAAAQRHPRARPAAGISADSVDTTVVLNFYKASFADAGKFTFVIVGDFEPDSLRPLIEQYIGGLPGTGKPTTGLVRDLGIRPPSTVVRRIVVGGDSLSNTRIVFNAESAFTPESRATMQALASILGRRLMIRLREDLGGTYFVDVNGEASRVPYAWEQLGLEFAFEPERVDELQQAAMAVIDTLLQKGITEQELQYTQKMLSRRREVESQANGYWLDLLTRVATDGWTLEEIASEQQQLRTVTTESIHAAMRRLLTRERYILVMELPVRLAPAERDELTSTEW